MKSSFVASSQQRQWNKQVVSIMVSIIIILPFLMAATILKFFQPILSQLLLFFTGWLVWTFIEYFNHRFRMHGTDQKDKLSGYELHINHHHHPTDIRISQLRRVMFLIGNIGLIILSLKFQGWVTLFTGLYCGFVFYLFVHVMLHQRWAAKLFPRLQRFHMHHHCKYPNRCFGVSVIWWDLLLNTSPPKEASISPRIMEFYFGNQPDK